MVEGLVDTPTAPVKKEFNFSSRFFSNVQNIQHSYLILYLAELNILFIFKFQCDRIINTEDIKVTFYCLFMRATCVRERKQ